MRFTIDVTPGTYTTQADLERLIESVRLTLSAAVNVIAKDVFPEYRFDFYAEYPGANNPAVPCHTPPF